jgi:redox-regulated HSP33 family molecular chaperone
LSINPWVDVVISVVVDMTDPSTIRMAGTWRQDFVNKASKIFTVTEVLPNGHTMTTMEKATFDPYTVPFLLLGNKYDKVHILYCLVIAVIQFIMIVKNKMYYQ